MLVAKLGELSAADVIETWAYVDPGPAMRAVREQIPVWPFPGMDGDNKRKLRWSNLIRGVYRARTALVVSILMKGRMACWLEIKLRPVEAGYRSVVFTTNDEITKVVPRILMSIARDRGMAPPLNAAAIPDVVSATVRRKHGPGDDPFGGRRILDGLSAV